MKIYSVQYKNKPGETIAPECIVIISGHKLFQSVETSNFVKSFIYTLIESNAKALNKC